MIASAVRATGATTAAAASTILMGHSLYLTTVGVAARRALAGEPRDPVREPATRFRVLIPAHNEELLIKDTLGALLKLDYPSELIEIHVVADNCTDRTAEIAQSPRVEVHERFDPDHPGKGPALNWMMSRLAPTDTVDLDRTVLVFLDADSIVQPDFLSQLNARFIDGAEAVQAQYAVRDESAGGEVSFRSAAFAVRHLVRPAGRVHLGGSSSLYGNGMAFTEAVARKFSWSPHLTEDLDMGLRLLLAGETVQFAPEAVVRGEMPNTATSAESQHQRWEMGRQAVARAYVPELLAAAKERRHDRSWAYVDAAIDISMPPFGTMMLMGALSTTASGLLGRSASRHVGVGAGITGLALLSAHVIDSLRLAEAPPEVFRSLARAPQNALWKLGVLWRSRSDSGEDWIRTTRNTEVPR